MINVDKNILNIDAFIKLIKAAQNFQNFKNYKIPLLCDLLFFSYQRKMYI